MRTTGPLIGHRVLEFGGGAAAIAGRVLAELGAHVVRIVPPNGGPPDTSDLRLSRSSRDLWQTLDKDVITLDLASSEGGAAGAVRDALATTDLLIDGYRPGQLTAWGLDPGSLRRAFPHLVILSLSHYGQTGPYRDWAGSALTSFAFGGSLLRAGRPSDPPLPPPVELGETIGGITGALAAVTALAARGAAGEGDWIDCSIAEACLSTSDWSIPGRSIRGTTVRRDGSGPLYPVYPVTDGFVRMINLSPRQWSAFLDWLGHPPEFAGPQWTSLQFRLANTGLMDAVVLRETDGRTREALMHSAQSARVSLVPVYAPEDIPHDGHFRAREALAEVAVAGAGTVRVPRAFVRFGTAIPEAPRAPVRIAALPDARRADDAPALDFRSLRVVELGAGGVAPEAARYLALLGADVVKVESSTAMDFLRSIAGPGMHERSPSWLSSNRNKRSIELDLKTPEARDTLRRLLHTADVFVENNSGGVCERLGAGYAEVSALNPRIIYASAQMLGATGRASAYSGFGPSNQAISGISHLWTHPDNPKPDGVSLVHPDHLAGKMLAVAIIAALHARGRTGVGAFVDLSQAEFSMATIGEAFVEASLLGQSVRRGYDHPACAPHGIFPTMTPEEWVAICVETDAQWQGLRWAVGAPAWAAGAALDTTAGRIAARAALSEGLSAWTRGQPRADVVLALQAAGVPAMPVLSSVEQLADAHLNARGAFDLVEHPVAGPGRYEGLPFRFERLPVQPARRAPLLGEHTDDVIAHWLGASVLTRG